MIKKIVSSLHGKIIAMRSRKTHNTIIFRDSLNLAMGADLGAVDPCE